MEDPDRPDRAEQIAALVNTPLMLAPRLIERMSETGAREHPALLEVITRRWYRRRELTGFASAITSDGTAYVTTSYTEDGRRYNLAAALVDVDDLDNVAGAISRRAARYPEEDAIHIDLCANVTADDELAARLKRALEGADIPPIVERIVLNLPAPRRGVSAADAITLRRGVDGTSWELDRDLQFVHPEMAERLNLWRMSEFALERIPSPADVYLFRGVGRSNPKDERLFALAEVRELSVVRDDGGRVVSLPELEQALTEALESLRRFQARRSPRERLLWNRVRLNVWPNIALSPEEAGPLIDRYARETEGLGIETVIIQGRLLDPRDGQFYDRELRLFAPAGRGVIVELDDPATRPLQPLDEGARRIVQARRRGSVHPAELVKVLAPERPDRPRGIPRGEFVEHDLDADGHLVPVDRPPAMNDAGIVVGVTRSFTDRHPEGMQRVVLLGDPDEGVGVRRRAGVPADHRRARSRRGARRAGRVVRAEFGRADRDGLRHREHGLGRRGAAPDHRVHAGRRRDQRRRDRHQRRRAAVLERRGDDADAYARHPRDGAGERDGADRQAGARLRRRRVGRGQLRHRRLRPDHGPERAGAVLGARPGRRVRGPASLLRARLRRAGRAVPAPGRDARRAGARRPRRRRTARPAPSSRPSATSSPTRRTRAASRRSTSAS